MDRMNRDEGEMSKKKLGMVLLGETGNLIFILALAAAIGLIVLLVPVIAVNLVSLIYLIDQSMARPDNQISVCGPWNWPAAARYGSSWEGIHLSSGRQSGESGSCYLCS
jgi:hypothetical protein